MKDRKLVWSEARIDQLTHEIAVPKRWKLSARSEQLDATQKSLLDETVGLLHLSNRVRHLVTDATKLSAKA